VSKDHHKTIPTGSELYYDGLVLVLARGAAGEKEVKTINE
jgi:hypothetical protein